MPPLVFGSRWTFTAKGLRSFPSPFVTHYSPPVIYFFHRSSAGLHQALTNGSQPIILRYCGSAPRLATSSWR